MILVGSDGKSFRLPISLLEAESGFALGLSRASLDSILLDRARELGADVLEGTRVSSRTAVVDGGYEIEAMGPDGQSRKLAARILVNASGRGSSFGVTESTRRNMAIRAAQGNRLFACKVHLRGIESTSRVDGLYFFEGGYGGLAHIESGLTNLCMLIDENLLGHAAEDRNELLDRTVRRNPVARDILRDAVPEGSWLSTGPVNLGKQSGHSSIERPNITVGDAYAFIDPFTGSGILRALDGAALVGSTINEAFAGGLVSAENLRSECDRKLRTVYARKLRTSSILRRLATDEKSRTILRKMLVHVPGLARAIARATR